jgi:hypothetical protein
MGLVPPPLVPPLPLAVGLGVRAAVVASRAVRVAAVVGQVIRPAAVARQPRRGETASKAPAGRSGRRKVSGSRAAQALSLVQDHPGIGVPELATRMSIKQNYLYRVLPGLASGRARLSMPRRLSRLRR